MAEKRKKPVDERVYEQTRGAEEGASVVYDHEPEHCKPADGAEQQRVQDKAVADSFPASDAPAPSAPTISTVRKDDK
ncbi:MAG TPA: hypothetical protein VFS21_36925 [Roseiflexaceae bacterium]|nr:hypothetical protein [Roseiflexaceae bacterium]